ncbi:cation-translocating P-type ATPase [Microbacterium marinilacus]|uniref:Cation-translocating P-type ATPase n=1 Tax=Microbacterium marinilacus TaxID=415209 RepID=A0ABP7BD64_9MICO|nr:cation-translocating P-type ATPase [Microbacterium marinilacus]MBY0690202.1 cation-translocating P-type ATPase [Microbacterium marinilacus]
MAAALDLDPALADAGEVARRLGVDPERGLTADEAASRLAEHGPNELRGTPPVPLWRRVLTQLRDPLVVLLLVAAAVSVVAWVVEGAEGIPVDAIVVLAVIAFNVVIGLVQESRAADAVAALAVMTRAQSTVLRDGELATVPAAELVPGDVLQLAEGDQVGADARLARGASLRVTEASLTGESAPVGKDPEALPGVVPLGDRTDMVFRGTAVTGGTGRAIVTATGMSTEMGAIATMLDETKEEATPLQREISRVGSLLGRIVVGIAIVIMLTIAIVETPTRASDWVTILLLGVSLAVAAVPEGLPAILSVVLALGVQRMAKRNAVVKRLSSVETLGSASVICTDKTGTLTQNEMTIRRIVTASGSVDVTGVGYAPDGEARVAGQDAALDEASPALRTEVRAVLGAGSLANDAQLARRDGRWEITGDPTEAAFLVAGRKLPGLDDEVRAARRLAEVPFSSERKMMSTAHRQPDGRTLILAKGAPDVLLERCTHVLVGDDAAPLDDETRARLLDAVETLSADAFRTLGVAARVATEIGPDETEPDADEAWERDLVYLGVVGIIDPPRTEAKTAIARAHDAGVRVVMITGDHPTTAARIAADLGIAPAGSHAVTGRELDALSEQELIAVARRSSVYARVAPEHKLRIVDALQADGQTVAMTGDGVNDAPALKSADIGIAMGITGTEVTKEAAKMVLADDDFATIVRAVHEGRVIFDNIRKFLRYLLCSNMGEVLTMFFGVVLVGVIGLSEAGGEGIVVPLLATQILWINLVTDTAPALAMGVDPEGDDVMARPPRGPRERVIDGAMWAGIASTGITLAAATLFAMDLWLPGGLIPGGQDSLEVARTAAFTTLVLGNLFAAFNARSATSSAFRGLFANRRLWAAVALGAALQVAVVHVPPLQVAFGTAALDAWHWAVAVALASAVLWVEEVRKVIIRARLRRRSAETPAARA